MAPSDPMPRYALNVLPWYRIVSPGLSSVPANSDPIMTVSAPAASAFVMSPENLIPPSAISGIFAFRAALTHPMMAVICGMPTPLTTRVEQIARGFFGGDIADNHVETGKCFLHFLDGREYSRRVTMGGIDGDHVDFRP